MLFKGAVIIFSTMLGSLSFAQQTPAELCKEANDDKIALSSYYCSLNSGGCSQGAGSACTGVFIGPHPYKNPPGIWVLSTNVMCPGTSTPEEVFISAYKDLADCSGISGEVVQPKSVSTNPVKKCASIGRVEDQSLGWQSHA